MYQVVFLQSCLFYGFCSFELKEIIMKQGKTLQELGKELQRQRLNRQDFPADTRSLEMESDSYGSMLNLSLEGKSLSFTVGETAHQQIAVRLNIKCRTNHRVCSTKMSMSGLIKIRNVELFGYLTAMPRLSFLTVIVVWTIWNFAWLFCLSSTR